MTDEEVQALNTELESTRTELEGIKAEKETLSSELETKGAAITELEQAVATKDSTLVTLTAEKEALGVSIKAESQRTIDDLTDSYNLAVTAYKTALSHINPAVPGELITGDTIEAIDQSLENAKTLVNQVRQVVEAEIAAGKVPAGAPARTPPDLSALSPREKIQYAIGGNK